MAATRKSTRAPEEPAVSEEIGVRLMACYGLLSRASVDLGLYANVSTKCDRALEDVVAAREAIHTICQALMPRSRLDAGTDAAARAREIKAMVTLHELRAARAWESEVGHYRRRFAKDTAAGKRTGDGDV